MHPVLRVLADRQLGLFTASDALRAGYPHPEIRRTIAAGRWVRVRRGVYATAEDLTEIERSGRRHRVDCLAVVLSLDRPAAAISHASAARLWGVPVRRTADRTVRLTDPGQWRRGRGFLVSGAPLSTGETTAQGPLRLTAPARTLLDCAREWPLEDAVVAMDAALLSGRSTIAALEQSAALVRLWPGGARAARAVSFVDGRAESPLESRGRLRIVGSGLPTPELQVEIRTGGQLRAVVDAWFDEAAVAVEFDGRIKYTDPWRDRTPGQVLWEEKRREDALRALDIRVVRIAEEDVEPRRWPAVEARLRELLSAPGPAIRRFAAVARTRGLRRSG